MSEPVAPSRFDPAALSRGEPIVRRISRADLVEAVAAGLRDFQAAPLYGLLFGGVYAVGGMVIVAAALWAGLGYLVYPLAAGFVLIGPFVAVGLYEVSRRREQHRPLGLRSILSAIVEQGGRELGWMSFVGLFVFVVWMYQVRLLLALFLGFQSFATLNEFLNVLVTTPEGLLFLGVGNVVGAALALGVFTLTVVSVPLLVDRDVDIVTAMITSVRAVAASPLVMLGWGAIVVVALIVAIAPFFLGLFVILPVLGHATWHLYRRAVLPGPALAEDALRRHKM